ncbi:hypothetical protein E4191_10800 [Paracoccus liaowanqingii]|uniref:Uncharacterized protein n=1 Tax=Paracoccus liaowanqingii TaxID=2560053 RepID=A0A4P7HLM7_9RHOB|nr:hypothetical protein [Paracoccus liaowanqingii]QBX35134.1 hypothetical protein E4191_10800 [Paracoccus liaowanqingii]
MSQFASKILLIALVTIFAASSGAAQELKLTAKGSVQLQVASARNRVLGVNVIDDLRDGLKVRWLQDTQVVPFDVWDRSGFDIRPDRPNDWSRLSLTITLSANNQLVQDSYGMELSVVLAASPNTYFYGEQQVPGSHNRVVNSRTFYNPDEFVLVLQELPPVQSIYDSVVALDLDALSANEKLEVIRDLILIYKIDGKKYYLNDLARAVGFYLRDGHDLPYAEVDFLQQLHMTTHFESHSLQDQAVALHALAFSIISANASRAALAGTDAVTYITIAKTLLNQIAIPDSPPDGTPYSEGVQKALVLKTQIACLEDSFLCLDEIRRIQSIVVNNPIDIAYMRPILQSQSTALMDLSTQLVRNRSSIETFATEIASDSILANEWILLSCLLDEHDGRLRRLGLNRELRKVFDLADMIRIKSGANC